MARKKIKLAFISNDNARKATYKKRKKGMIKKVRELSILCGISACAIISSPFDDSQPEVWPNPKGANEVIHRCLNSPVLDQNKNVNQESFIMMRIVKALNQVKKLRVDNNEKEMTLSLFQYLEGGKKLPCVNQELKKLDKLIEKNIKEVQNKLDVLVVMFRGVTSIFVL